VKGTTVTDLKIAIVTGSTRPGRLNGQVAEWVLATAREHGGAEYEILDIADFDLPLFDQVAGPYGARMMGIEMDAHAVRFQQAIAQYDGFVFVAAEYNHSITGALKNALDYVFWEFHDKAAAIVSYGGGNGLRAAEHLRGILSELAVAHVRETVSFNLATDFEQFTTFRPNEAAVAQAAPAMFDRLLKWSGALKSVREGVTV
jgi:NAD(P)H-dependent FMN reductase